MSSFLSFFKSGIFSCIICLIFTSHPALLSSSSTLYSGYLPCCQGFVHFFYLCNFLLHSGRVVKDVLQFISLFQCHLINCTLLPPVKFISLNFHLKTIFPNLHHFFFMQANTIENVSKLLFANFTVFVTVHCSYLL